MGDSYRPPLPPPPQSSRRDADSYRPLAPRPSRDQDSYRPAPRDQYYDRPPARNDFSFQPPANAPRFPPAEQQGNVPQGPTARRRPGQSDHRGNQRGGRYRGRGRGGYRPPPAAHDRALLQNNSLSRDEEFMGISDLAPKFNALEASDDDNDNVEEDQEQPSKKLRAEAAQDDGDEVPKWSNPDPYTSLPPPDDSQRKKKDFVQLIRKAKVDQEKAEGANAVSENIDFISFNFGDEGADSSSSSDNEDDQRPRQHAGSMNEVVTANGYTDPPPPPPAADGRKRELSPLPPPPSKKRKVRGDEINGSIVADFRPKAGLDPTPWCNVDHSRTESVGMWLHKEICDFYEFVRPHKFEDEVRNDLVHRVKSAIRTRYRDTRVLPFGSFAAGLYLPTADMDLVMISDSYYDYGPAVYGQKRNHLYQVLNLLERQDIAQDGAEVVFGAKVPIIKFIDKKTALKVDLSFENMTGVVANGTFQSWKLKHPAMPKIVTVIKHFLLMRGLNEVFLGGIGGFTVTCLVTMLLEHMPAVQSGNMDPDEHLGDVLLNFFDLYGNKFNFENVMICMNPPRFQPKGHRGPGGKPMKFDRLCIIDPNNADNDISGGSAKVKLVFHIFADAHKTLMARLAELDRQDVATRKDSSILGCIFAGDYQSFTWQRQRLQQVYAQRFSAMDVDGPAQSLKPTHVGYTRGGGPHGSASGQAKTLQTNPGSLKIRWKSEPSVDNGHLDAKSAFFAAPAQMQSSRTTYGERQKQNAVNGSDWNAERYLMMFPQATNVPSDLTNARIRALEFQKKYPNFRPLPIELTMREVWALELKIRFPNLRNVPDKVSQKHALALELRGRFGDLLPDIPARVTKDDFPKWEAKGEAARK